MGRRRRRTRSTHRVRRMLEASKRGLTAWAIAFAALAGYCAWDGTLSGANAWARDRQLSERYARGRELMRTGETAERYRRAVEEAKGTRVKKGWFGGGG